MNDKATMYKWTSVALAVLLIIVGVLWVRSRTALSRAVSELEGTAIDYRRAIEVSCGADAAAADVARNAKCRAALADFEEALIEYRDRLSDAAAASGTTTIPAR